MGPLAGVTIIELAGLGALPYGTLKLADMGADVIRVHPLHEVPTGERPGERHSEFDRGRRSIAIDLKSPAGVRVLLRMIEKADVFCEAFRPGVCERLGIGPDVLLARNPKLVYGRLTGWGQDGPLAPSAGHSLNYEALTGAIGSIGAEGMPPIPMLQVFGDFAGGGLHLAYGVVCALFEAQRSGKGQVVDAAMVDGVMSIFQVFYGMTRGGFHTGPVGTNLFDGGAPFYNVYETADGKFVTVAPIEARFYAQLLDKLGIDPASLPDQNDMSGWPTIKARFAEVFRTRTRDEWDAILGGTDCCYAPVLSFAEAGTHPHNVARGAFVPIEGSIPQLRPMPRLSRTPGEVGTTYAYPGCDTEAVLGEFGLQGEEIAGLAADGVIAW
ncbi:MAG: CoA transferase [Acidimicrobiia bacterium]|nr:CoA transferase [Acidimicrobiia bacterium]